MHCRENWGTVCNGDRTQGQENGLQVKGPIIAQFFFFFFLNSNFIEHTHVQLTFTKDNLQH